MLFLNQVFVTYSVIRVLFIARSLLYVKAVHQQLSPQLPPQLPPPQNPLKLSQIVFW